MAPSTGPQPIVPILLYHGLVAEGPSADRFTVSTATFESHLALIRDAGRLPLTVSELVARRRPGGAGVPPNAVAVTFDDGRRDFLELGVPLLEAYGIPSTMYVVAGLVGRTSVWMGEDAEPLMGWPELRSLEDRSVRVELGAHSVNHLQLDIVGAGVAAEEIRASKTMLEDGLQRAVPSFAYPFGHHRAATRRMVIDAGFESACAVKNRLSPPDDDGYALARVTITADWGTDRLAEVLAGREVPVAGRRERLATKGYRVYRRSRTMLDRGRSRSTR